MAAGDDYSTDEIAPGVYAYTPNQTSLSKIGQAPAQPTTISAPTAGISTPQTTAAIQNYIAQSPAPVNAGSTAILPSMATAVNPATPGVYDSGFRTNPSYSDPFKMVNIGETGWDQNLTSQLSPYGITQVPQWMTHYGASKNYDKTDFGKAVYETLNFNPTSALSAGGKAGSVMSGWKLNDAGDIVSLLDPNKRWDADPTNLSAAQQAYLERRLKENSGGFNPMGQEGLALGMVLAPIAAALGGYALGPAATMTEVGGAGAGLGVPTTAADLTAMGSGVYGGADAIGSAIASGAAAGADVGMGAGTSWLTDLGFPAAYGNDLASLISYGANSAFDILGAIDIGNLIGGSLPGLISGGGLLPGTGVVSQPTNIMAGTTSAPQTSPIAQGGGPISQGSSAITPAVMPTGSIMGAFANRSGDTPDYMKYLSPLF